MTKGRENKPHIGIFGRRNNGKSSLINRLAAQEISIVSDFAGTTTDPVKKSIEITGFGPVILIDTAGIDDVGDVGKLRVNKSIDSIKIIDLAILVVLANEFGIFEQRIIAEFNKNEVPWICVINKTDIIKPELSFINNIKSYKVPVIEFSALTSKDTEDIIQSIKDTIPESSWKQKSLLGGLVNYGDIVLLITPIDIEAPEGRLILPQVQTIRDILDNDCTAIVVKEREVDAFLRKTMIEPALVITDSQIFLKADASIPKHIPLTGFSVLLARHKGDFENYLKGTPYIDKLKDNDKILILESCTHHVSCDDIGRVKIPRWLSAYTGKKLDFEVVGGLSNIPGKITDYALVIQCGGCVITRKQIINRLKPAVDAGIPVTNYGMTIAYLQGIYSRAIAPFTDNKEHSVKNYL
ncbi:MAG TPA: [FeFe] hydrogenase H-cluster maturation GTPase HydF [Bacteroidales bacterium]|jgi:[FeFe] hydrogenase H-cluster maturation GTPase HydF|nr:[FeFe] hydrogenase H-cluster maturation GTPase HydF [Bacteroidales bacterium]MDD4234456.1 [FeFe] hydrogenase H-cluster maturation GTPase HydF [Bacteroidales bacterium]MDY0160172.1 [FeFe] hydrogenase H-cluster maturation GTPase HydF [Bacteroidales bacterium]HXK80619.1 [FeFe] hydrogenase H-cluster maturation GTPase HydF [Bacteroidales bacterium]